MKKNNKTIFTPVALSLYFITVVSLIVVLFVSYRKGPSVNQEDFIALTKITSSYLQDKNIKSQNYSESISDFISSHSEIAFFSLTTKDESILTYTDNPEKEYVPSKTVQKISTELLDSSRKNYTLEVCFHILKPSSIFRFCLTAFIIIMIITFVSIIKMIATDDDENDDDNCDEETQVNTSESAKPVETGKEINLNINVTSSAPQDNSDCYGIQDDVADTKPHEPSVQDDTTAEAAAASSEKEPETSIQETPEAKEENQKTTSTHQGLYNHLGLVWEEYFSQKLDSELVRASGSETDLSYFIIQIPEIDHANKISGKIAKVVLEESKIADMVFQYKNNGYSLIVPACNTETALKIARKIHNSITEILSEKKLTLIPYIGITSKSLRLISGKRIINEAEKALEKAKQDRDNPIVAFKVEVSKYEDYLTR